MLINLLASSDVNTDGDEKFSWYLHRIYSSRLMLEFLFFFHIELGLRHTGFNLGFVVAASLYICGLLKRTKYPLETDLLSDEAESSIFWDNESLRLYYIES